MLFVVKKNKKRFQVNELSVSLTTWNSRPNVTMSEKGEGAWN